MVCGCPTHLKTAVVIFVVQSLLLSLQLLNDQITTGQFKGQQRLLLVQIYFRARQLPTQLLCLHNIKDSMSCTRCFSKCYSNTVYYHKGLHKGTIQVYYHSFIHIIQCTYTSYNVSINSTLNLFDEYKRYNELGSFKICSLTTVS